MNDRIYLSSPDVGDLEEKYLLQALRSGWIAPLGPDVDLFEQEMSDRIGRRYAVALSSGTAALHLALLAHGVGPGDAVLTSTMTFAATANAIAYTGAEPFFIDCLPDSGNMDPELLKAALESLTAAGQRIGAIVPVDLLGKAVDYTVISGLASAYGVPLIADAAESLGAVHDGRPAGAWGEVAIFSFNGNKIMTTSGGGMLLTDDGALASRVRYLATQARQPVIHYEHTDVGYNYRLSNLLAALGRAQLVRLDEMILRRQDHRRYYRQLFDGVTGISIFGGDTDTYDNFWLTSIVVDPAATGFNASDLSSALAVSNIESRPLWKPMHLQPVFRQARGLTNGTSQRLFETGLTLPSGSAMSAISRERVGAAVTDFLVSNR
ncbi:aminotransferase class I/II-fold pyridoxal phosphate-dependent enzyme [Pseudarthrobacter sp. H3Y2-7]|uniref:DegT/DnrJ/EryC1/StrS family aminotransferase n=1 Tax=Pseudarthrobacter naphthalenicus TaxID=3031328 RepID=UPI0023AF74EC|nr:aminotransferase class I/II-fold pyridoxal phosphate-dependent enzyme [Pseudarthrobacter sp. H3Y2-7]MDE8668142.1 aminotransferase class I/II-fold pyridoxal phosphate-dependent enzyme [Pseudarthrobacter sp. H3Y2-7]